MIQGDNVDRWGVAVVVMNETREYYADLFSRAALWPSDWPSAVRWAAGPITSPPIIENERDESVLVLVPEGEFLAGGSWSVERGNEPFRVHLPAYYLGICAVTNDQYARFLQELRPSSEELDRWIGLDSGGFGRRTRASFGADPGNQDHPAVKVSWEGAFSYCTWAGLRLPTELEWEKGARGVDGREFPWGGKWDPSRCRNKENKHSETTSSVWSYPEGASPWGLYQMSGNVWEWCADEYEWNHYSRLKAGAGGIAQADSLEGAAGRVLRGGSWDNIDARSFRCTARSDYDPMNRSGCAGFRVARTS